MKGGKNMKIRVKVSIALMFLLLFSTSVFAEELVYDLDSTGTEEVSLQKDDQPLSNSIKPTPKNTNFAGGAVNVHGVSHPGYINANKQRKHIPGSPEYEAGKSIWSGSVDDAINVFHRLAGNGTRITATKERISTSSNLGLYVELDGTAYLTRNAIIHYSNTGAHIIPAAP